MGQPKQLLPIDGQPMVRRVVQAVCEAGLAQVVVVLGAEPAAVGEALAGLPVQVVENPDWSQGLSGSLRAGLAALEAGVEAALLVLADQPGLSAGLLRALVDRYQASGAAIVAPFFEGKRGNPVLFGRSLFGELSQVEGDRGGRELLSRHEEKVERLEIQDPTVLRDVDTMQDYQELCNET